MRGSDALVYGGIALLLAVFSLVVIGLNYLATRGRSGFRRYRG